MLLFLMFLNMAIAIFFIMLAKVYYLYFITETFSESTPGFWFISRVLDLRIGFIFIVVSILCSQIFRVKVFDEKPARWINYSINLLGIFITGWGLFVYEYANLIPNAIFFGLVMLILLLVFIPFSLKSFHSGRSSLIDPQYKRAFFYLGLMGVCFIAVLVFDGIDQAVHLVDGGTYSIFYFLGWVSHIIAMLFAYFGFLGPNRQKNQQNSPN